MKVYQAINAVQADLAREGIGKERRNQQQGYNFRGIDDVYNALAPLLSKHKLVILPRVLSRECSERATQKGGVLFYTTVEVEFDFIASEDGSRHTVKTFGEAMDSADKSTNKAMSAAYKYAAMQAFAIPTEGDNDADADTPDVAPEQGGKPNTSYKSPANKNPFGPDPAAFKDDRDEVTRMVKEAKTEQELVDLYNAGWVQALRMQAPKDIAEAVTATFSARRRELRQAA